MGGLFVASYLTLHPKRVDMSRLFLGRVARAAARSPEFGGGNIKRENGAGSSFSRNGRDPFGPLEDKRDAL